MIKEIRYETNIYKDVDFRKPTIFLAGPTVRGNQPHLVSWRFEAISIFKKFNFHGNLIIPEFTDKKESDKDKYELPLWEYHGLCNSHVNLFWLPRTRELIGLTTNDELGYWRARDRSKVVYGRSEDAYRCKYQDIMWFKDAERHGIKDVCIYHTLEDTIRASIYLAQDKLNGELKDQETVTKWRMTYKD